MAMKLLGCGLIALVSSMTVEAKETPAEAEARDAKNRAFVLANYPPRARAAGEQGVVYFDVSLDRDGRLRTCEVIKSSGFPRLDDETCELMVAHAEFTTVKDAGGKLVREPVHHGAIKWELPEAVVATAAPQRLADVAKPERLICRRITKPGSMVVTERRCLTARDWALSRDFAQSETKRLQDASPRLNH